MMQIERTGVMDTDCRFSWGRGDLSGHLHPLRGTCWNCPSDDTGYNPGHLPWPWELLMLTERISLWNRWVWLYPLKVQPCFFRPLGRTSKENEKQLGRWEKVCTTMSPQMVDVWGPVSLFPGTVSGSFNVLVGFLCNTQCITWSSLGSGENSRFLFLERKTSSNASSKSLGLTDPGTAYVTSRGDMGSPGKWKGKSVQTWFLKSTAFFGYRLVLVTFFCCCLPFCCGILV